MESTLKRTWAEISLDNLTHNFETIRRQVGPKAKLLGVVKADAYGHGAVRVAKHLERLGAGYLAVSNLDECEELRVNGIMLPILMLGFTPADQAERILKNDMTQAVPNLAIAEAYSSAAVHAGGTMKVHIKLDTGMHRLGFNPREDMDRLIDRLQHQNAVIPRSVFSHFVGSDSDSFDDFSARQFALFDEGSRRLQSAFSHHILRHIDNSAGIEHFPEHQLDMCRLGLGLYGINSRNNAIINTVSTLKTTILQLRHVPAGDTVGYSRKGVLTRDSVIAAIPIGYADGLNRHLGNRHCYCLVNGKRAEYVGNICMDVCMIDVTDIDCAEGDSVEIFGEHLPVTVLSDAIDTIPYEILTGISNRVKRVYYQD